MYNVVDYFHSNDFTKSEHQLLSFVSALQLDLWLICFYNPQLFGSLLQFSHFHKRKNFPHEKIIDNTD